MTNLIPSLVVDLFYRQKKDIFYFKRPLLCVLMNAAIQQFQISRGTGSWMYGSASRSIQQLILQLSV